MDGTRKLSILALAAAMLAVTAHASPPADTFLIKKAGDLLTVCTVAETDPLYPSAIGFCHGYLVGAYQYHEALYSHGRQKVKPMFCLPDPPPSRVKAIDGYIAWLRSKPAYSSEPAVQTIFEYLRETYPCRK